MPVPADARSLISVSPSEPGAVIFSSKETGSVGDLLDLRGQTPRLPPAATSLLVPTSSLPNLQPTSEQVSVAPPSSHVFARSEHYSSPRTRPRSNEMNQNHSNNLRARDFGTFPVPLVVSTSYLTRKPSVTRSLSSRKFPSCANSSTLPRVRGRKERKGASRHSYLHAVQDKEEL